MAKTPKVIVLRTAGTNCDVETAYAFQYFKAKVDLVHINQVLNGEKKFADYHILALPGGFTYGDDVASGRILANEIKEKLYDDIQQFIADKKLVLGICNGFQVLVKSGLLSSGQEAAKGKSQQKVTLTHNDSGKFEDRWVHLKVENECVWTKDLDEVVYYPVAHAEGKFVAPLDIVRSLNLRKQVVFRYCSPEGDEPEYPDNPNGSVEHIAGITDQTGRVLGLMPHPERHFQFVNHPFWTRLKKVNKLGQGARLFKNACDYIQAKH